jgi:hypothetical protein
MNLEIQKLLDKFEDDTANAFAYDGTRSTISMLYVCQLVKIALDSKADLIKAIEKLEFNYCKCD